jgi:hypothetical protein
MPGKQYFSDGLDGLIRVYSNEEPETREFFFSRAEKLGSDGRWYDYRRAMLDIFHSGYYEPTNVYFLPMWDLDYRYTHLVHPCPHVTLLMADGWTLELVGGWDLRCFTCNP